MKEAIGRMRPKEQSRTLPKMLSLLPVPKHFLTPLSTAEKKTCKQDISAIVFGTCTIFTRAVPKISCSVNGALVKGPKSASAIFDAIEIIDIAW